MKNITIISLFLAVFLPVLAPNAVFAATWVTPSGAIVDDSGKLIAPPPNLKLYAPEPNQKLIKPAINTKATTTKVFFFTVKTAR